MILHALEAYYRRKQADPDPAQRLPAFGLEDKEIPFILEIDATGRLLGLSDTRSGNGKKKTGQRFLVPQGVKKTSGVAANLLWDTAEYVLGIDTRGKPERVAEQNAAFGDRIAALNETAQADAGIRAIQAFLHNFDPQTMSEWPEYGDILESNPLMSFRLQGDLDLVCQRPAVVQACRPQPSQVADSVCLVTGQAAAAKRLHPAIKGVWGAQTSGANIVSFNLDAFNSYGKTQGGNAPMSPAAAFSYTTALNHLLARGSRQRMQVGDTSTVFWAEEDHDLEFAMPDLFGEPRKDEPDRQVAAVEALYSAVRRGTFAKGGPDTRFHVLGLAPNAARISIRIWETASALELGRRIQQHFEDIAIVHRSHEPDYLSLFRLLIGVAVLGKVDNIPPNLGGDVMRAILQGQPYPASLLNLAVQRCRAEQQPNYARAAIIKGCLNRLARRQPEHSETYLPMLDPNNMNPAYRLGRLFATLEKVQEEANPSLNATIRDRYYGAASSTPVAVFSTLLRLKNHHLGKLSRGRATQMEKLIGEITAGLDGFSPHLSLADQGRFALGYYHQRQDFFTHKDAADNQETAP